MINLQFRFILRMKIKFIKKDAKLEDEAKSFDFTFSCFDAIYYSYFPCKILSEKEYNVYNIVNGGEEYYCLKNNKFKSYLLYFENQYNFSSFIYSNNVIYDYNRIRSDEISKIKNSKKVFDLSSDVSDSLVEEIKIYLLDFPKVIDVTNMYIYGDFDKLR